MNLHPDLFLTFAGVGVCIPGAHRAHRGTPTGDFASGGSEFRLTSRPAPRPAVRGPRTHPGSGRGDEVK